MFRKPLRRGSRGGTNPEDRLEGDYHDGAGTGSMLHRRRRPGDPGADPVPDRCRHRHIRELVHRRRQWNPQGEQDGIIARMPATMRPFHFFGRRWFRPWRGMDPAGWRSDRAATSTSRPAKRKDSPNLHGRRDRTVAAATSATPVPRAGYLNLSRPSGVARDSGQSLRRRHVQSRVRRIDPKRNHHTVAAWPPRAIRRWDEGGQHASVRAAVRRCGRRRNLYISEMQGCASARWPPPAVPYPLSPETASGHGRRRRAGTSAQLAFPAGLAWIRPATSISRNGRPPHPEGGANGTISTYAARASRILRDLGAASAARLSSPQDVRWMRRNLS